MLIKTIKKIMQKYITNNSNKILINIYNIMLIYRNDNKIENS